MPEVSVIMNCRNGEKYLREAIDSVYAQTFRDWEIVFYDNLSTDESPVIAKSYGERLRYFRGGSETPLPLGAARNEAIKKATGEFVAFLDADDIWMPRHLEILVAALDADSALAYSNFITRDMSTGKEYMPFSPAEFHKGRVTEYLCRKNFIWLQAVLVRTETLKRLNGGPFDPGLLTAEDFDFILRLSMKRNFNYVPEPTLIYRMHESNLTTAKRHYFAHDFSLILEKYKDKLDRSCLKGLARQYLLTVRLDLNSAGFRAFPFLRLGLSLRQILISLLFVLFPDKDLLALKAKLRKPLDLLKKIF